MAQNLGKIHTKAVIDVLKRWGSFESCSAWEEANGLLWGRKSLSGGLGVGGNYTD